MTLRQTILPLLLAFGTAGATLVAAPAHAGLTIPVQCELGTETLLSWDDVAYDLRGTCGVVRLAADGATVTMPAATRLEVDGTGNTITAKPLAAVTVTGSGNTLTAPTIQDLVVRGSGASVTVAGMVEHAELSSTASSLTADTVNVLRLRGADSVTARMAYRTRITGSDNVLRLGRSDRVVLTGDRNGVTVERGRTTVRDKGQDNVLDLRRSKKS